MSENNKNKKQDREEQGYGYDKSIEDLKVIGQNTRAKNNKDKDGREKKN